MSPIRLHDLRHTWATLALQAGVHPKVVSERLGHATTSITLDLYSHVQPELDAQAAEPSRSCSLPAAEPWRIHFFRRHTDDDRHEAVPAIAFLDGLPVRARAEIVAVLEAVATAPPPAFSGGGKWETMHGDMAGFYEVHVRGADRRNHRLFCVLERDAPDLGGSSIVCIDGLSKPLREAAHPRDYRRALRLRQEFRRRRTVLR